MPHTEVATIACIFAVLAALHGRPLWVSVRPAQHRPTSATVPPAPFTMTTDVDPARIPSELPVTKCNCPDSRCSDVGDYRCQEVRSTFRVAYRVGGGNLVGVDQQDGGTDHVVRVHRQQVGRSGVGWPANHRWRSP
ncbi:hypothetical protein HPB49_023266 [Dermacentor silvarum]|uniref:Uncharacterized protein n=1 Tax=Dermacentor silvarum TaxID=543639 RepID=A0ACB8DSA5_DERSI|nr:hypothetical protein HPB49_023266 [Dermacentor silvarum]